MSALVSIIIPLFGFMFIPVWIPLVSALAGMIMDRLVDNPKSDAELVLEARAAARAARAALHSVPSGTATGDYVTVRALSSNAA